MSLSGLNPLLDARAFESHGRDSTSKGKAERLGKSGRWR